MYDNENMLEKGHRIEIRKVEGRAKMKWRKTMHVEIIEMNKKYSF